MPLAITISQGLYWRRIIRYYNTQCINCKKSLEVGNKVVSKRNGSHGSYHTRWYCVECAKKLRII